MHPWLAWSCEVQTEWGFGCPLVMIPEVAKPDNLV